MLRFLRQIFSRAPRDAGADAERRAEEWLRRNHGFVIVARNWRSPQDRRDELDLVCRDRDVLVFVEVKARATNSLVPGYYAVNARKKRALRRAARTYLSGLSRRPHTIRFDIVELILPVAVAGKVSAAEPEILHFENVPLFPKHWR